MAEEVVEISFIRYAQDIIVRALKLFFGKYPECKGLENIALYRWVGDYDTGEVDENKTLLHIISYYPDDERFFPAIIVETSGSRTRELGFGQLEYSDTDKEVIGGLLSLDCSFTIESPSGLDTENLSDLLVLALVSNNAIRGMLAKQGIAVIAPGKNIVSFGGSSIRVLASGSKIKRATWKYNELLTEWRWETSMSPEILEEILLKDIVKGE